MVDVVVDVVSRIVIRRTSYSISNVELRSTRGGAAEGPEFVSATVGARVPSGSDGLRIAPRVTGGPDDCDNLYGSYILDLGTSS